MVEKKHVAVVGQHSANNSKVTSCLKSNGLEAESFDIAVDPSTLVDFDLVILDVSLMPDGGSSLFREIRARNDAVAVFFIDEESNGRGFEFASDLGVDAYLLWPLDLDDLVFRAKAILRCVTFVQTGGAKAGRYVRMGDLALDMQGDVVLVAGRRVELTPNELRILKALAARCGEVLSGDELIASIWGEEYMGTSISIPTYIRRIREKIESDPSNPQILTTVRGRGYCLTDVDFSHESFGAQ